MPPERPPPPQGTITSGGGAPSCAAISTPTLPCPSITSTSSNEGTSSRALFGRQPGADLLAALGGAVEEDDLGARRARPLHLHRRRVARHDDGRGDAERAAPRGATPWAWLPEEKATTPRAALGLAQQQQPVGRAAQLEAAALLQAFGLHPEPPPLPIERQQRRLA